MPKCLGCGESAGFFKDICENCAPKRDQLKERQKLKLAISELGVTEDRFKNSVTVSGEERKIVNVNFKGNMHIKCVDGIAWFMVVDQEVPEWEWLSFNRTNFLFPNGAAYEFPHKELAASTVISGYRVYEGHIILLNEVIDEIRNLYIAGVPDPSRAFELRVGFREMQVGFAFVRDVIAIDIKNEQVKSGSSFQRRRCHNCGIEIQDKKANSCPACGYLIPHQKKH